MNISLSADLERLIAEKLQTGKYRSADEVIQEALKLLDSKESSPETTGLTVGEAVEMARRITEEIPEEAWNNLPSDFSKNVDHYLYGSQREE